MQTWALFVDSYRLLVSRKLFWITFALSGVALLVFASLGFDDEGWFVLFGAFSQEDPVLRAGSPFAAQLYLGIYSYLIIGFWFTWIATILALISTTSIFVDFMADGAIDMVVSRPISRVKVFLVKYTGSLLFVFLQIAFFTFFVVLCIRWRLGDWHFQILYAIPLVLLFYSYLYSVNVLLAMLTRSSLASLLLTLLFWLCLWGVQTAERFTTEFRVMAEVIAEMDEQNEKDVLGPEVPNTIASSVDWDFWNRVALTFQFVLPKNKETLDLIDRYTLRESERGVADALKNKPAEKGGMFGPPPGDARVFAQRVQEEYDDRSLWYILGTSLAFEAIVLGLAMWLFVRRDFG